MTVISPCDYLEAKKALIASVSLGTPVYLRLAREKTSVITTDESPFEIGKANLLYGTEDVKADVGIIATGALVHKALRVAEALKKENISVKVLNVHTIKPLDEDAVLTFAKDCGALVTVEEHQIIGGLGGAVAEYLSSVYPTPIEFIGVHDQFGQSGTPEELIEHYGMGEFSIANAVKVVLKRKF